MSNRDELGRTVRDAWIAWARTQPNPKPSWLVPYDELSEADKEADRQIAERVLRKRINGDYYPTGKEPSWVVLRALESCRIQRDEARATLAALAASLGCGVEDVQGRVAALRQAALNAVAALTGAHMGDPDEYTAMALRGVVAAFWPDAPATPDAKE